MIRRQFGIVPLSWMIGAAVLLAVSVGGVALVSSYRAGQVAKTEVKAARAALPDCRDPVATCIRAIQDEATRLRAQVDRQNQAVAALEKAAKNASERARRAREAADKAEVAGRGERSRLEALMLSGNAPGDCPAGQAVAEVRKGLRP